MAVSIGNLALILSANSSQLIGGIDVAATRIRAFGRSVEQALASMRSAAERPIFAAARAEIKSLQAELGAVNANSLMTAFDRMSKASDGSRISVMRAREEYERLKMTLQGLDIESARQRAAFSASGGRTGSNAIGLGALGVGAGASMQAFNARVIEKFGSVNMVGGQGLSADLSRLIERQERMRFQLQERLELNEMKRKTSAAMGVISPGQVAAGERRDVQSTTRMERKIEKQEQLQLSKDLIAGELAAAQELSAAEKAFAAARSSEMKKLDKERQVQHDRELDRQKKVEAGDPYMTSRKKGLDEAARERLRDLAAASAARLAPLETRRKEAGELLKLYQMNDPAAQLRQAEMMSAAAMNPEMNAVVARRAAQAAREAQRRFDPTRHTLRGAAFPTGMDTSGLGGLLGLGAMGGEFDAKRAAAAAALARAKTAVPEVGAAAAATNARRILQAEEDYEKMMQGARRYNRKQDERASMFGQLAPVAGYMAAAYGVSRLLGELRSGFDEAVRFEASLKRVELVSQSTGEGMIRLTAQARELALTGLGSHTEIAKGAAALAHSGLSGPEIEKSLKPVSQLALLSQQPIEGVAEAAAVMMRSMGAPASEMKSITNMLASAEFAGTARVQDLLDSMKFAGPWARQAGMGINDLLASLSVLSNAGIKGEMGGTTMRMMFAKMSEMSEPARMAMKRFGLEFKDAKGNFRGLIPVLEDVRTALAPLGEQQKAHIISEIFSVRAATGVLAMVNDLDNVKSKIQEIKDRAADPNMLGNLSGEFLNTTMGKLQKMKAAWRDFTMSTTATGFMGGVFDNLTKVLTGQGVAGGLLGTLAGGYLGYRIGGVKGAALGSTLGGTLGAAAGDNGVGAAMSGAVLGATVGSVVPVVGTALGAIVGALSGTLISGFEKYFAAKTKQDAEIKKAIVEHPRDKDMLSDFEEIAGVQRRRERTISQGSFEMSGTGRDRPDIKEMMIGGKWKDVSSLSADELRRLRQQVPGQETTEERYSRLQNSGMYGQVVLAWEMARTRLKADAMIPGFLRSGTGLNDKLTAAKAMQEENRIASILGVLEVPRTREGFPGRDFRREAIGHEMRELTYQKDKWVGVGSTIGTYLAEGAVGRGNMGFLSNKLGFGIEKYITDQQVLQEVHDRTVKMNDRLTEQASAATEATRASAGLYAAHRDGLPWLQMEAEKIKLNEKYLREFSQLEVDERRAREAGNQPSVVAQITQAKKQLSDLLQIQMRTKINEESLQVLQDTRYPEENYKTALGRLDALFVAGGIDRDVYGRAVRKAGGDYDQQMGVMNAWKAGGALEAGSGAAISAANFSRYEQELSSAKASEEHLREMLTKMDTLQQTINSIGGAAGFAAELAKALLAGEIK